MKPSVEFIPVMVAVTAESDSAGGAMAYPDPDVMWTEDGYMVGPDGKIIEPTSHSRTAPQ